jgi:hypothetical protein
VETGSLALIKCSTHLAAFRFEKKSFDVRFPRANTASQKRTFVVRNDLYGGFTAVLSRYQKSYGPATLLEFGATDVRSFGGPILVNEPVLVGIERTTAGRIEHLGIRVERVTGRRRCHGEHVAVLVTN